MKKILEIKIINPEFETVDCRGIVFGYNRKSSRTRLIELFCEGILEYTETKTESAAFLSSLIISASETIQANNPEIAALVRKTVIEFLKNQKKKP